MSTNPSPTSAPSHPAAVSPPPGPDECPHPEPAATTIPFTAPWHYELHFPCDARAPGIARLTLRAVLAAHGLAELADRAELLTSELATNSVRHTRGPASVRLQWLCPVLRVSVWDMSPDLPGPVLPAMPSAQADGGRGLPILELVADRWGGCAIGEEPVGPGGKTLWFELRFGDVPPPALAV